MGPFDWTLERAGVRALIRLVPSTRKQFFIAKTLVVLFAVLFAAGCDTLEGKLALGTGALTALGGRTPSHEIQQTYYLGVFDPQGQVEPSVYRVRLHGQSSFLNRVQFASGWLPSIAVDSIGTRINFDEKTGVSKVTRNDYKKTNGTDKAPDEAEFETGRRLIMFGPEGFREAPANHRLVVAMGSDPEAYFQIANEALEAVASVTQTPLDDEGSGEFKNTLLRLRAMLAEDRKAITIVQLRNAGAGQ